jgi:hypothetical protein
MFSIKSGPYFRLSLILLVYAAFLTGCQNNHRDGKLNSDDVQLPLNADGQTKKNALPIMEFDKKLHDFGDIRAGEKVSYPFRFVNRGRSNLLIQNASGSCGCTVPDFPKEPIPPGREGFIRVLFNSEGKNGVQEKQVTILANTLPNTNEVRIKANIKP